MNLYHVTFDIHPEAYYVVARHQTAAIYLVTSRPRSAPFSGEDIVHAKMLCDSEHLVLGVPDEKKPDLVVGVDRASGESYSVVQEYHRPEDSDEALDSGGG